MIGVDDEHVRLQAHQQLVLLVHPPLVLVRLRSHKCDVTMREGPAGGKRARGGEYTVAMYKRGHQRCRDDSIRGAADASTWRAYPAVVCRSTVRSTGSPTLSSSYLH